MTRLLVCEGACNPALPRFDGEVEDYRRQEARYRTDGTLPALSDPGLLRQLHSLLHTPHRQVGPVYWACTVCSSPRRY